MNVINNLPERSVGEFYQMNYVIPACIKLDFRIIVLRGDVISGV